MDVSSILKLSVLVVTTSVFFQYCIRQNAREANEAWHHLCGGRLHLGAAKKRVVGAQELRLWLSSYARDHLSC